MPHSCLECSRQVRAFTHRADPRSVKSRTRWHVSRRTVLSLLNITLVEVEIFSDAHNYRNIVAGQHVYWQEQVRHAWKELSTAGSERAAQDCDQAACDEVHVAVTQVYRNVHSGNSAHKAVLWLFKGSWKRIGHLKWQGAVPADEPLSPGNLFSEKKVVKKAPISIAEFLYVPVRKHLFGMSTFSKSGVHSSRSRTLVSALLLNRAITTDGPHDVPPTRPSSLFSDKCVTGTAPVTAAFRSLVVA